MGGLAGILHFRGDPPSPSDVDPLLETLRPRGPDKQGTFAEDGALFGACHRQLDDSEEAAVPWVDDALVVGLDGWIYDESALARRAGSEKPPGSDVEALAWAWRKWGVKLTDHLDGDFAAFVYERDKQRLTLLRDRLGVRPLFWTRDGDRFAFASTLPALRQVPWVEPRLAREHLAEFLSFRIVHAPRTMLRDLYQVEPAHWLEVDADGLRTRRYWRPQYPPDGTRERPGESEVIDSLQEAVVRSVRRRLLPDRTALYLSGGLGSTAIASAARQLFQPLVTFTISFADDPHPESPFAGRVAKLLAMDHHEVVVGTPDLAARFSEAVSALGQPLGNPSQILQLALARAAAEHADVVLSGDGGEELFGGRMLDGLQRRLRLARAFSRLPGGVRRAATRFLSSSDTGRAVTTPLERWGLELGLGGSKVFGPEDRRRLLRDERLVKPHVRHDALSPFYANLDTDPINAVLHAYLRSWLCEGSLTRADRTAAAAGVDIRFPLLDRDVVQRASRLPGEMKIRRVGGSLHTRWPLRAMLDGVLPPPLVHRPKRGMPSPLDAWFAGPGRLFMEDRFEHLKADKHELWRPEYLDELRRSVVRGRPGMGIRLWLLLLLDAWLDTL